MFLPTVLLCVLSTALAVANDSQTASVKEVPQPPMTLENASPLQHAAYYAFNKGEPFFLERDPISGAIDFSKKTTPTSVDNVESNTAPGLTEEKVSDTEGDYFYDDQEIEGDGIDRKDGGIQGSNNYRPNDIFQNPYKISPDLHQFLSLPVHYSSSDKFPLISNSYANTKVQGTGGSSSSYSNHKYVTSTTLSPSYYTMPTTRYTTLKPQSQSTTLKTTTRPPTTQQTSTTTETDEYEYSEYEESDPALDNQAVPSEYHTSRPDTTKYTVTTYRPTTYKITTTTTIKPTSFHPTTEKPKQEVSIVTSLPLDVYYSTSQETTSGVNTTASSTTQTTTTTTETSILDFFNIMMETKPSNETQKQNETSHHSLPSEEFYTGFGQEPFRPIYGSSDSSIGSNNNILYTENEYPKPAVVSGFQRLPPYQNVPYVQKVAPTLPPQMEPPRPDAPQSFYPEPEKQIPGQHVPISYSNSPKPNTIRPVHENIYERPPAALPYNKDPNKRFEYQPQAPAHTPVFEGLVSERPIQSVKPRPSLDIPVKSNFKMPSKVENHFIKVSSDQENPSYSLQTSFSIGVPAPDSNKAEVRPGQGVGQVLFPDDTPAESSPVETNVHLPSPVLRPPTNNVPVQSYQPNRPPVRGPPPPLRIPNEELPAPGHVETSYPRPHWENHAKPLYSAHNSIPKKDIVLPQYYPGLSKGKPENIHRQDLPNILPQFRPNAKLGQDYHHTFNPAGERLREPFDTLQPPPLPRPQHLRINRNDEETEIERVLTPGETKVDPLVHRRSGPQPGRVTTLQMMKQSNLKKTPDNKPLTESDKPVFVVYPSAHGMHPQHRSPPDGSVVIGTRAQRPLPPANLEKEKDDLDTFPLDDNKHFPIPGRDRADTPILKTKNPNKHLVKNDFPYPIVKPQSNNIPEERILSSGTNMKEYTAFSPTPQSSTEDSKEHESEINLIPYLQDYMPFATKKPSTPVKPLLISKKDTNLPQKPTHVISTTLNTSMATEKTTENDLEKKTQDSQEKSGSEMTVSATMYTQQRPVVANHKVPVTYTPSEPQPVGFQAPFMASLSEPQNGWNVVTDKNLQPAVEPSEETPETDGEGNKFDIENFQPQLFGGFQPILHSSEEDSSNIKDKDRAVVLDKGDREERGL